MAMMHSDGAHEHAMFTVTAAAPAITAARLASVAAGAPLARREDQANLSPARRTALRNAIVRLVEDGKYIDLIRHHMDMSHNMHGSMGEVGLYRFLGWHRRYLVAMEREIQRVDAILRPGALDKLGIPYWRWQDPFPAWLAGFLPAKDPSTGQPPPPRKCASPPAKPDATDIHTLVSLFSIQMPHVVDPNDYTRFTWGLEGWGKRPDGTSLPAHNHGHAWIGGVMNNTSVSPTDPIFWLHHAEVDRLWEIWRQANPAAAPRLNGNDRTMDPWPESYDDLLDVAALGYAYDSLVP
jgi:tyrosinase